MVVLATLIACSRFDPVDPPDRWTDAHAACDDGKAPGAPVPEACADLVADDFGDPAGVLLAGEVAQLRLGVDPDLYDLEAFYVEGVREATNDDRWAHEGHIARWDVGDRAIVVYPEYEGLETPLELGAVLAHETGHGRPHGRAHVVCRTGEFAGQKLCDRWEEGAIATQLWFADSIAFPGMAEAIGNLQAATAAQLEAD